MSGRFQGGCVCGALRYRFDDWPRLTCDCHCVDCRRSSGAPFVSWATVQRDDLQVIGGVRRVKHAERLRSFAACCGTHLFFEDAPEAETIDVAIATLDDPAKVPPEFAIWTEDRLPWVLLDPAKPAYRKSRREG